MFIARKFAQILELTSGIFDNGQPSICQRTPCDFVGKGRCNRQKGLLFPEGLRCQNGLKPQWMASDQEIDSQKHKYLTRK